MKKPKKKVDPATAWMDEVLRYDNEEQTHTGMPAPGDEDVVDPSQPPTPPGDPSAETMKKPRPN